MCANTLVEKYDNFAGVAFKSSQVKPNMPTTHAGATAAQTQGQLDDENVLEHVLQTIIGFPTDSEAAQALDDAGVRSVKDLLMLERGDVRPANL